MHPAARREPRGRAAAVAAADSSAAATEERSPLQTFLLWLINNGVEGVGAAGSKVALFEGEGSERGVVCVQPIPAGEVVLRVPTRLAITDDAEEGEPEAEQPWSVRLAGRLLGMAAEGEGGGGGGSPWSPYLAVLPEQVPSPLTTFSWEDVQAIEYQPMLRALEHAQWLASSAGQQPGGARFPRDRWDWALSVCHSRTFGAPGRGGGVGVRMLVPLIDMLNHAGDVDTAPPGARSGGDPAAAVRACENVRWDLKAPAGPEEGEWVMVVTATRAIQPGEELLLSYGERGNDDFMLHYGFVPPRNPHDDVALFTDIEAAVDWWLAAQVPLGALSPERLTAAINAAYSSAEEQDSAGMAAEQVLRAVPEAEADVIRSELARIKLSAGGMVDGRLLAAFRSLYEIVRASGLPEAGLGASWAEHARAAVARRSREVLASMPTPLPADLQTLAAWEAQAGQAEHCWAAAAQHYTAAVEAYEARHGSVAQQAAAPSPASQPVDAGTASSSSSSSSGDAAPMLDAGADAAFAQLLLQHAAQQQLQAAAGDADEPDTADGASSGSRSASSILPIMYRAYKKQILWDAVLLAED